MVDTENSTTLQQVVDELDTKMEQGYPNKVRKYVTRLGRITQDHKPLVDMISSLEEMVSLPVGKATDAATLTDQEKRQGDTMRTEATVSKSGDFVHALVSAIPTDTKKASKSADYYGYSAREKTPERTLVVHSIRRGRTMVWSVEASVAGKDVRIRKIKRTF